MKHTTIFTMSYTIYFNVRLIIAGIILTVGASLFWGIIPPKLRNSIFDTSRKCIGLAIMILPFSTMLIYFLSLRFNEHNWHIACYLTACYVISIFVTVGFVPLLGAKFDFKQWRFIRGLISIPFFALPMSLSYLYGEEHIIEISKYITIFLLITTISYQSYIFGKLYKDALQRGNNYYSDDVEVDIRWILKSVSAFFLLEIICAISTFFKDMGYTAELILTIYRVATILYVYGQFISFMKNFESMKSFCENTKIDEIKQQEAESSYRLLSDEQHAQIGNRINKWVEGKGFTENGVTIEDVAREAATNRTYLSIYINTTFECSYKVWVTSLRIELSKRMLLSDDSIIDIAHNVGFSSPQSFMHSFKRSEGITPTQWRNQNKQ